MSSAGLAVTVALGLALAVHPARAQQTTAAGAARVRVIEALAAQADSVARRVDSTLRARRALDTVRSGALRVITDTAVARKIRPAVEGAWRILASRLGPDTTLLTRPLAVVAAGGRPLAIPFAEEGRIDTLEHRDETESRLLYLARSALLRRAGHTFRAWGGASLGFATDGAHLTRIAYVDLVTTPSRSTRLCRAGDVAACAAALGLGADSDRVRSWYSADDLRVVLGRGRYVPSGRTSRALAQCEAGDDARCFALAAARGPGLPAPLGASARASLVVLALNQGGRGAFNRLVADSTAPLTARLASTAGMPFPALVELWRSRVLAAAPPGTTGATAGAQWTAAGWVVILLALGMRSSRWRRS